jgi:light-regulated signal transduction histidine kinase (bacteriophytochrome)
MFNRQSENVSGNYGHKMNRESMQTSSKDLLKKVIDYLNPKLNDQGVLVTYGNLPDVGIESTQLETIFRSLIQTAISNTRGVHPRIHFSVDEKDSEYIFLFQENGKGNAEEILNELNNGNGKGNETGSPIKPELNKLKETVAEYNGKLWINSFPNVGSIFYFTIPKKIEGREKVQNRQRNRKRDKIN